ncbi:hypothetical protein MACJ_003604 [Theileria orientalis]|uniref:Nucleoporin NSP1-like C-terminal domain-containing protein n=1 Tax=Theileria orientalis TaxID=68886 RepID=A0A976SLC3_THEOR|nr:hypothetical protein MACJ_003604 [Theileria orientalis]
MSSSGEKDNNSDENNTNKPVSNIFGSSTKSSISNLFTAQGNTSDSFNDPSSSHVNFGESPPVSSLFDKKPVEGDLNGEKPSGFSFSENLKSSDSAPKNIFTEMPPSSPGEKKDGVVLVTLSERIDPSMYKPVDETSTSNVLNADNEQKSDDSHKPTDELPNNAGLFTEAPRDESRLALNSTQCNEPVTKEDDSKVATDVNSTQGHDYTQNQQLTSLDNDLLTSPFGTSGLLPSQPFSTAKTFDLIENEHTSKMTEPSVSSNAASLTESINGQGSLFGDVSRPSELSTEDLKSKVESSVFGSLNSTQKQTNLFGSTSPSNLFGNQETTNKSASNDTNACFQKFGSSTEVKSEPSLSDILSKPGTAGTSSNLFGSATSSATNLFGSTSTNVFGSAAGTSTVSSSSIFGSSDTPVKSSLFGNIDTSSATTVFGQASSATVTGTSDTTAVPTVASETSGTAASALLSSITNLFGTTDKKETSTVGNLFGTTDTTGTGAGTSSTNLFGSSTSGLTSGGTTSSGNLFGTSSSTPGATTNLLGKPSVASDTPAATGNLFGTTDPSASTTNLFGTTTDKSSTSNLFGTTSDASSTSNLFGKTDTSGTSNLFGTTDTSSTSNLLSQTTATGAMGASTSGVKSTATVAACTSNLFGTTGTSSSASNLFGTTDSASTSNLFGTTTSTSSSNLFGTTEATTSATTSSLFGTTDATSSSNLFGTPDAATSTATSNLFGTSATATDKSASTSNLFGTTDAVGSSTSNLFGTTDTSSTSNLFGTTTDTSSTSNLFGTADTSSASNLFATTDTSSTSNLFGTTTTTTMDKPSTSDLFKTTQAPASTTSVGTSGASLVTQSTFNGLGSSATEAGNQLTSSSGLLSNDKKTESLVDSTTVEQSKPRVTFNLPSDDAKKDGMQKTDVVKQVDTQASMPSFTEPEQLTIGNLLDNWERKISEKVRTFNSFADRVATIDQQIVLQCNNINGLINMHKELLEKHQKMENLMRVIEEEQKMALSVLDNMEKILSGKLESLNRRSSNYNVTQAITRNLQELTDQLASTTKATENIAQVCQPEPIFTIAKILSFHQISLIDLEKQCDEIDGRIRSMQRRV